MSSVKGPERAWREVRERPSGLCGFLKPLEMQPLLSNVAERSQLSNKLVGWQVGPSSWRQMQTKYCAGLQVSDGGVSPPFSLCDLAIPVPERHGNTRYQCQQSALGRVTAWTLKEEITAPLTGQGRSVMRGYSSFCV